MSAVQTDLFLHPKRIPSGIQRRDAGCAKVLLPTWSEVALQGLQWYASTRDEFTAESFRVWWSYGRRQEPHHLNAWGALMRAAAAKGMIEKTGAYVQASDPAAHARMIAVWRKA